MRISVTRQQVSFVLRVNKQRLITTNVCHLTRVYEGGEDGERWVKRERIRLKCKNCNEKTKKIIKEGEIEREKKGVIVS